MRRRIILLLAAVFLLTALSAKSQEIRDGEALLAAMHARYEHSWYDNVTFTETADTLNPDGTTKNEIWYEALMLPGKLRIDVGPASDGNTRIFSDGGVTSFQNGKLLRTRPFVHMLLVLGFDVYRQPMRTTIDETKAQGFDLRQIHEENWEGQDVYVVGAQKGDLKSKQFWIEKKRLLFVRLLEADEHDPAQVHDDRFSDYRRLSVGWIAAHVEFYTGGKRVFVEQYSDIKENVKLDPALFDPSKFNQTQGLNGQTR